MSHFLKIEWIKIDLESCLLTFSEINGTFHHPILPLNYNKIINPAFELLQEQKKNKKKLYIIVARLDLMEFLNADTRENIFFSL